MPTIKQQVAAQKMLENAGKSKGKRKSTGQILKEAGYSKAIQKNPQDVTKTLGFRDLLHKMMPDNKVAKLQSQLMNASRLETVIVDSELSDEEIKSIIGSKSGCKVLKILHRTLGKDLNIPETKVYFLVPDNIIRKGALDMFYKLENKYPKDKEESDANSSIKNYLDKLSKILP